MKKFIKSASFFLTLTIIFSVLCGVSAFAQNGTETGMSSEDIAIAEYEAKAAVQREATQAYAALSDTFGVTEDGETIYPDDYAGAWIEGATLYVALTSLDNSSAYDSIFKGANCVVYKEAAYSLNELKDLQTKIYEAISSDFNITALFTEVDTNTVVFEVKDDCEAVENKISDTLSDPQVVGDFANRSKECRVNVEVRVGESVETQANLRGGMEINRGSSSGPGRSIGVCGTFTSNGTTYSGIVTAGHNLATSGTSQKIYRDGSDFGRVSLLMWKDNANGDWACVRKTNNDTLTNKIYGTSSSYTRNITGTKNDLAKGTYVMKYGYSGGYCTGTVEAQDVQINDGTYTIKGLTRCSLDSGSSLGGDSGGPYYTQNTGNSYNFVGVHEGISGSGNSTKIYFTPYVRFKSYFTVKTS